MDLGQAHLNLSNYPSVLKNWIHLKESNICTHALSEGEFIMCNDAQMNYWQVSTTCLIGLTCAMHACTFAGNVLARNAGFVRPSSFVCLFVVVKCHSCPHCGRKCATFCSAKECVASNVYSCIQLFNKLATQMCLPSLQYCPVDVLSASVRGGLTTGHYGDWLSWCILKWAYGPCTMCGHAGAATLWVPDRFVSVQMLMVMLTFAGALVIQSISLAAGGNRWNSIRTASECTMRHLPCAQHHTHGGMYSPLWLDHSHANWANRLAICMWMWSR